MLTPYRKSYPIPEIMYDPSLLLSVQVFLLGILYRHRAFDTPMLTSAKQLHKLDIHPGEVELPLPIRDDMKEVYVFRRAVKTLTGYDISPTEPITYNMMAGWIKRVGEILGLAYETIPYNLRYNAANEFDESSLFLPAPQQIIPANILEQAISARLFET